MLHVPGPDMFPSRWFLLTAGTQWRSNKASNADALVPVLTMTKSPPTYFNQRLTLPPCVFARSAPKETNSDSVGARTSSRNRDSGIAAACQAVRGAGHEIASTPALTGAGGESILRSATAAPRRTAFATRNENR